MSGGNSGSGRKRSRRPQRERLYGQHVIRAALETNKRRLDRLFMIEGGPATAEQAILVEQARGLGLAIEEVPRVGFRERIGIEEEVGLQGMALEVGPLPVLSSVAALPGVSAGGQGAATRSEGPIVALDGVEDPRNLGAIVRVAEAAGASGLLVTDRRCAPLGAVASRASAGALERLPVARIANLVRGLEALKKLGFWVFGADAAGDQDLFAMPDKLLSGPVVVVLGAEGRGLRPSTSEHVDHRVRIPMAGGVGSLNVSTAAAVMLFEWVRRRRTRSGRDRSNSTDPGPVRE